MILLGLQKCEQSGMSLECVEDNFLLQVTEKMLCQTLYSSPMKILLEI